MPHPYEQVSFIKLGKRVGGYWCVEPPSDYGEGWCYGELRALELLQWCKRGVITDLGFVLNQIADAQRKFRDFRADLEGHNGAINGFWRMIGLFAAAHVERVDFDATAKQVMARRAESAAALAAHLKKEGEKASERARRAANARWGKKAA